MFVLHPKGRISDVQRRQMTTSTHANVHNIALEGSFDDAQALVKALFAEKDFAADIGLTAVNSINFVRIAAQAVYYFTATAALKRSATFVVPTGNFGDIFAGEAASRMGLGIERLVIATNSNDILARALNTGVYESGAPHHTLSPSMDIQVASNFERALFEASGRDADWTTAAMNDFTKSRKLELPPKVLAALRAPLQRLCLQRRRDAGHNPRGPRQDWPHSGSSHRRGLHGGGALPVRPHGHSFHRPSGQVPGGRDPRHRPSPAAAKPLAALEKMPRKTRHFAQQASFASPVHLF